MGTVTHVDFRAHRSEWPAISDSIGERLDGLTGITTEVKARAMTTARRYWQTTHDVNLAAMRACSVAAHLIAQNAH